MVELRASFPISSSGDADLMDSCIAAATSCEHRVEQLSRRILLCAELPNTKAVDGLLRSLKKAGFQPLQMSTRNT